MRSFSWILSALLAAACAPRPSLYADSPAAEVHQIKVMAADRMVIDGQPLTLADAEAPRPGGEAACRAEAIAAAQASQTARSLLLGARHLEVQRGGSGELRLVNVDGLDLGQTLIAQGLAVARGSAPMDWCHPLQPGQRYADVG